MRACVFSLLALALVASPAFSDVIVQTFTSNRDNGNDAQSGSVPAAYSSEDWANRGNIGSVRAVKTTQEFMYFDFDSAAILAWQAANPLVNAGDAYSYRLSLTADSTMTTNVQIKTLNLLYDWAEGNGANNYTPFNWGAGTAAAVDEYAQCYWKLDVDGVTKVLDTAAANVKWTTEEGTQLSRIYASSGLFKNTNTAMIVNPTANTPTWIALDSSIVNDLLNNPLNRGLVTYAASSSNPNAKMYTKETGTVAYRPTLEVTLTTIPEPATMGLLALGAMALIRRRR